MSDLILNNVRKEFPGGVIAVESFSLRIPSPCMTVLVGPSGCGKTTLLRMIAGLERPTGGEIHLGDKRIDTLEPRHRDVAMVFQNYALYPHMTVAENLSFGLRLRKVPRREIEKRVGDTAQTLEIDDLLARRPGELSGGQRQRVALGRAIIRKPQVFLFDEPLSNLDARLRNDMRGNIKRLYQQMKVTSIYVTHDQVEAMTIGEMLVVMNQGRIHQVGTTDECYNRPADTFVATFLGSPPMNLFEFDGVGDDGAVRVGARAIRLPDGLAERARAIAGGFVLGVRPEAVTAADSGSARVTMSGKVVLEEPLGHETLTHIDLGPSTVIARGPARFRSGDHGDDVTFGFDAGSVHLFERASGSRVAGVEATAGDVT